ncbi:hypothetical protein SBA3_1580022 [Candidatus Sulfopaludibacter sp. SbA3]|nr:hypothetical protein SBA3_1580022 [Candidatus Sulfopaludibacter sp. SbA3]
MTTSFDNYPGLEPEDVQHALAFAAANLEDSATGKQRRLTGLAMRLSSTREFQEAPPTACVAWDVRVGMPVKAGCRKAADEDILAFSLGKDAIVVTPDADFHAILAVSGASRPTVIRLRIRAMGAAADVGVILSVLGRFGSDLRRGSHAAIEAR